MSDPFAYYMDHWTPTLGVSEAFASWLIKAQPNQRALRDMPFVMPDIKPFLDTSGKWIEGRAAWREHLQRLGAVELGLSDLKEATQRQIARKQAAKECLSEMVQTGIDLTHAVVKPPTQLAAKVAERLENRPMPDRATLIGIVVEENQRRN
mgnify:CR=1 FL=1